MSGSNPAKSCFVCSDSGVSIFFYKIREIVKFSEKLKNLKISLNESLNILQFCEMFTYLVLSF
jgi:hypothetical protein